MLKKLKRLIGYVYIFLEVFKILLSNTDNVSGKPQRNKLILTTKPDVYRYRKLNIYLSDLIFWHKDQGSSLRGLAKRLNVSPALLSLVTKGKRPLTEENVDIWARVFKWNAQEVSWLKQLVLLECSSLKHKGEAMEGLSRFKSYNENSPEEVLTYKYLKKWWNVTIREMSELPDFQEDEEWIQVRLLFNVSITDIKKSLKFLNKHKLLAKFGDFRRLNCQGEIYKLSLATFHKQMLDKAVESIYKVSSDNRYILGQTLAIEANRFPEAKMILEEALDKVIKLGCSKMQHSEVFHFYFMGFPLTMIKDKL